MVRGKSVNKPKKIIKKLKHFSIRAKKSSCKIEPSY